MPDIPFKLRYALTRRQRIVPHLRIWLRQLPVVIGIPVVSAIALVVGEWWLLAVSLLCLWFARGFWIGLLDIAIYPVKQMDVVVEQNGLGFMAGGQRRWLFLDGMVRIDRL